MKEFLHMGGYGAYVWAAFGLAAAVLIGMAIQAQLWHRRMLRDLRRRSARPGIGAAGHGRARREAAAR